MRQKFLNNAPLVLWAFLIFLGSSLPPAKAFSSSLIDFMAHKAVHLLEYGVLYLLYYRNAVVDFWQEKAGLVFQGFIFVTVFGAFDEYHQSLVPGRTAKVRDVFIDVFGALLGYLLWRFLRRRVLWKPKI